MAAVSPTDGMVFTQLLRASADDLHMASSSADLQGLSIGHNRPITVRKVIAELKERVRWPLGGSGRRLGWSVDVGSLSDSDLGIVVEALSRCGIKTSFEREFRSIAHFDLTW
jgi:hypothetical protein